MEQAQPFQIDQAAPARSQFAVYGGIKATMFASDAAKCPDQRHVSDHVHHLAIDRRGTLGKFVVQRSAVGGEMGHGEDEQSRQRH